MQDADQAGIALVDLGAGKQQQQSHSWAAVDEEHFNRHPGLSVLQMAWHPGFVLFFFQHPITMKQKQLQQARKMMLPDSLQVQVHVDLPLSWETAV